MRTIPIPHLVAGVACASLFVVALIFVPDERLAKLATLAGRIIEDPAGAVAAVSLIAGAITTLRAAWVRVPPSEAPRRRPTIPPGTTMALALALLSGCSPSALRTHQTIATIARVSVVAAHPAIVSACETLMSRCTDDACLERVGHDCEAAAVARDTAHAAVRAYVDTIQIAAHADEGRVAPALDLALSTLARVYDAAREAIARTTGYQLPELPPEALPILRALTAGAVEVLGGGS